MGMEKVYTCDCCGMRVDYYDAEGDHMVSGFTRRNNELLCVDVHVPSRCGYGGYSVPQLSFSNLCGPECFNEYAEEWLLSVVAAGRAQWSSAVVVKQ